jgi:hypothetical protein
VKGATRSKLATLTRGARFRVRDGFRGVGTERHSRRVPDAATLHPQGEILERDTFQAGTFGAGGCRIGMRHVPEWNTRVGCVFALDRFLGANMRFGILNECPCLEFNLSGSMIVNLVCSRLGSLSTHINFVSREANEICGI